MQVLGDFRAAHLPRMHVLPLRREGDVVIAAASHDGYRRLPDAVEHHRTLVWSPGDGVVVVDVLRGRGHHAVCSSLHVAPDAPLEGNQRLGPFRVTSLGRNGSPSQREGRYTPFLGKMVRAPVLEDRRRVGPDMPFGWSLLRDGAEVSEFGADRLVLKKARWLSGNGNPRVRLGRCGYSSCPIASRGGATQTRVHTFAAGLADRGYAVEVICEVPNHPQGVVHPDFRGRLSAQRALDGFRVIYVWVYARPKKSARTRLAFSTARTPPPRPRSVRCARALMSCSRPRPPLPVAAAGAVVAARHRVPWVMDVRDLWPEAAVGMGELSNPTLLRMAEQLEERLYRSASAITATTERFARP